MSDKQGRRDRRRQDQSKKSKERRAESDPEVRGKEKDATEWQDERIEKRAIAKRSRNMHFGIGAFGVGGSPKYPIKYEEFDDEGY